jgi:hypothetical protein
VDREELAQLRDAIDMMLARQIVSVSFWPNGSRRRRPAASKSHAAKRYDNPAHARAAERRLLAAMREHPGLSAASLAKVVGAGLSTTKDRLKRMGAQELIGKVLDGRWRVKAEEPQGEEPGPQ